MSIRYEIDQYDIIAKYVDDVLVATFKIDAENPLYVEWESLRDSVPVEFVRKVEEIPSLDDKKSEAILTLRDLINDFMKQFTERFSDAELTNFSEQVLQAQDFLANGPNDYNAPITIEANITGYTPVRVCQLILGHHAFQKRLMPWVRSFRQNITKLIYAAQTFTELENVVLNIKPALYGALERNEI